MARKPRWTPTHSLVELSNRCIQGRFLLRPSRLLNLLIVGVLAMALRASGACIHAITVASNHWHILASVPSTAAMARAMEFFGGNVSKEVRLGICFSAVAFRSAGKAPESSTLEQEQLDRSAQSVPHEIDV